MSLQRDMPIEENTRVSKERTLGAIASSLAATCFLAGMGIYLTLLDASGYPDLGRNPVEQVEFLLANSVFFQAWYSIVYLLFGASLVVVVLVLQRHREGALVADVASVFGLIWAGLVLGSGLVINVGIEEVAILNRYNQVQASALWQSLYAILEGLGGGNELIGGLWILMISVAPGGVRSFQSCLIATGVLTGLAGIATIFPAFSWAEMVFGLGSIAWFGGVAVHLLNAVDGKPRGQTYLTNV